MELAGRLNKLFDVMHPVGAPEVSNATVAAAVAEQSGISITSEKLGRLRDSSEKSPGTDVLLAIAEFFGVSAAYLTDVDLDPSIDAQLNLLRALREHRVLGMMTCRGNGPLSPEILNSLADTLNSL